MATLAVISTVSRLFAYLACIAAIPRLDAKEGNLRPLGGILLPLASALLCLWAASQSRVDEWKAFIAFLIVGSLLYLFARIGRRPA